MCDEERGEGEECFYGRGLTRACFWSSFILLRIRYMRYYMAFWWMDFMRLFIVGLGMFRFFNLLRSVYGWRLGLLLL